MEVQIVWGHRPDPNGQPEEQPFLHVQNLSDNAIFVTEVNFLRGTVWRTRKPGTAIEYTDPFSDLNFPYCIEAGKSYRFELQAYAAKTITDATKQWQKWMFRVGRSPVRLEVATMTGSRKFVPAWDATPWENRAEWLKR